MSQLLREWSPIIFQTQAFEDAYEEGLDAICGDDHFLRTETELISEFLQLMLNRWDDNGEPVSFEWSVGFLVGQLHALFVPALKYVNMQGCVQYSSETPEPADPSPTATQASVVGNGLVAVRSLTHATR